MSTCDGETSDSPAVVAAVANGFVIYPCGSLTEARVLADVPSARNGIVLVAAGEVLEDRPVDERTRRFALPVAQSGVPAQYAG